MSKQNIKVEGIIPASMSIFKNDLTLDNEKTLAHAENLLESGSNFVVFFGSTGQAQLISSNEKKLFIKRCGQSKYKDRFIIGTGSNSLQENIELLKLAQDQGIFLSLLMGSAYFSYDDSGAYQWYKKVIENLPDSKIIIYNYEKLSGFKFSKNLVEKLAKDFSQIIGVKDSTANLYNTVKIPNFKIFVGTELRLLENLKNGGAGLISATVNVTSSIAQNVYQSFKNGNSSDANEHMVLVRKIFDQYNLISSLHSYKSQVDPSYKNILPPLKLLDEINCKKLFEDLKKINFKKAA
jgi:4-hydroxy-tetrahydrodipicolinate synthase